MAYWLTILVFVHLIVRPGALDKESLAADLALSGPATGISSSAVSTAATASNNGTFPLLRCSAAFKNWLDLDGSLLDGIITDLVPGSEELWAGYYCNSTRPLQLIKSNRNYGFDCSVESADPEERMAATLIDALAAIDAYLCANNSTALIQLAVEGKECVKTLGRAVHSCAGTSSFEDQQPLKTILISSLSDSDECRTLANSEDCISGSLEKEPFCTETQQRQWGEIIGLLVAPCVPTSSARSSTAITTSAATSAASGTITTAASVQVTASSAATFETAAAVGRRTSGATSVAASPSAPATTTSAVVPLTTETTDSTTTTTTSSTLPEARVTETLETDLITEPVSGHEYTTDVATVSAQKTTAPTGNTSSAADTVFCGAFVLVLLLLVVE